MSGYVLTTEAQNDLRHIRDHLLKEAGFRVARRVTASIIAAIHSLVRTPGLGHRREDLTSRNDLRFWRVFSYLIVYRVDRSPLTVAAIIHAKQDVKGILSGR
jgi:plasmid stabilization system protein ParE